MEDNLDPKLARSQDSGLSPSLPPEPSGVESTGRNPIEGHSGSLTLRVSASLLQKLHAQAEEEGVSCEELANEILGQGVVVRAWEYIERNVEKKNGNRSHFSPNNNGNNNSSNARKNSNNRNFRGNENKNRRNMSQAKYHSIMDDKASFLEYVRSQDPSRRR